MFVRPNHVTILDDETGSGRESGNASPSPGHASPSPGNNFKDKSPTTQVRTSWNFIRQNTPRGLDVCVNLCYPFITCVQSQPQQKQNPLRNSIYE